MARHDVPAGTVFGHLTVIDEAPARNGLRRFKLLCVCGRETIAYYGNLKKPHHTTSCGCRKGKHRHGMAGTPTHDIWIGLRTRCLNPKDTSYRNYGGRGITVDPRWSRFENFFADMGERPPGMDLDRIDNNRGYEPGNCRWATRSTNLRNTRRTCFVMLDGTKMSVSEAAERLGVNRMTIGWRVSQKKITHQEAIDHYAARRLTIDQE